MEEEDPPQRPEYNFTFSPNLVRGTKMSDDDSVEQDNDALVAEIRALKAEVERMCVHFMF